MTKLKKKIYVTKKVFCVFVVKSVNYWLLSSNTFTVKVQMHSRPHVLVLRFRLVATLLKDHSSFLWPRFHNCVIFAPDYHEGKNLWGDDAAVLEIKDAAFYIVTTSVYETECLIKWNHINIQHNFSVNLWIIFLKYILNNGIDVDGRSVLVSHLIGRNNLSYGENMWL